MMAAWRGMAGFMGIFKEQVSDSHRRLLRDENIHQRKCDSYDQYKARDSLH